MELSEPAVTLLPNACLTVPSWVIPGNYVENLHFLNNKTEINGVELLFFLYDDEIDAQLKTEWEGIQKYAGRFVFTAHLPDVLLPEHEELAARLAPLVRHFIVHPGLPEDAPALGALINDWAEKYPRRRPEHRRFLAENTLPGRLEALMPYLNEETGICMDTGHLLLEGKSPAAFLKNYGARVGEIHLHGLNREKAVLDGRLPDHRPVQSGDPWLRELFPQLKEFSGIVNTEVFSWEEAAASIDAVKVLLMEKEI
jgi:hypothetical protein